MLTDVSLAGDRRGRQSLGRRPLPGLGGKLAAAADEEGLEAIDERVGRQWLQRQLVDVPAETVRKLHPRTEHEQGRHVAIRLERGVHG